MHGLFDWVRANRPLVLTYVGLLGVAVVVGIVVATLPSGRREVATNLAAFLGILCLSVPTVRLNEQARLVHRAKLLSESVRSGGEEDADRLARLQRLEAVLSGRRGGWNAGVQAALYTGYVLLFASGLARLL